MAAVTETVRAERGQVPAGSAIRRGVRGGLLGGLIVIYLAAVGLVERFNGTNVITGVLSLGPTFFLAAMLFAGYLASRDRKVEGETFPVSARDRLVSGIVAGAVTGGIVAAFVLLFNAVNARDIFVSLSPGLLGDVLTFGQEPAMGALLQLGVATALGTLGAALRLLDPRNRKVFLAAVGTMLIVGVLERLLRVMLDTLGLETSWLYRRGGLTVSGAIGMFVLGGVVSYLTTHREAILQRLAGERRTQADEGAVLAASTQENLAFGLGLASLGVSVTLAIRGLLQQESSGLLLILALALGLVAIGVAAVTVRKRTGGAAGGTVKAGRARIGFFAAVASLFVIVPLIVGVFLSQAMVTVGIYVLLGLGLNIVVGYAGLLDLGYVAFFAVGAYSTALFTALQSSLVTEGVGEFGSGSQVAAEQPFTDFWIAIPLVVIIAVVAGVLIGAPVLRLRGDYLAIVTLGFGEIVRVIVRSDWAASFLGGSQGIKQVQPPAPEALDFGNPQNLYYLVLVFILLAAYVSWRLQFSRVGRAWAAMREDEDVAEAMGVSVIKYKLLAFAMGAAVGCLSGAFFAVNLTVITPDSFELLVSITVLAAIILGGLGSIPGVIVGSVVLVGLPEILRDFAEYRLLFYGAILVGIMILRPEGLIASARRRRELHERVEEEAQFAKEYREGGPEPALTATPREATESS
ncbi:MAG: branched-chain amino acid ABC transporter permease [Actinomycetota bacterium]